MWINGMLSARICTVLTFNEGLLTRTKKFTPDYLYTHKQVGLDQADEIVLLDVTRGGDPGFLEKSLEISDRCFAPLTLGGGIRKAADVKKYFDAGADKVTVNTGAIDDPELITDIAKKWGNQAVVLSIDSSENEVVTDCGRRRTGRDPIEWAKEGVDRGAGEIMVTSVEKDGSLSGYDLGLCGSVAEAVSVPVMFHAGAGNWKHFYEGLQAGASAVCTQNIYHFTDSSLTAAKKYLNELGVATRQ